MDVTPIEETDPVVVLGRIAYLLERSRASTYRVRAFRHAAGELVRLGPDAVARRARDGTLQELPGVGEVTASIATQVVHGEVPAYLTELEEAAVAPLVTGGEEVLAAVRGDLHTHSNWSDGGSPIAEMAVTARGLGRSYYALTDHSPRLKVANGLSAERLSRQIDVVAELNDEWTNDGGPHFRILTGIEVDILEDGSLDQSDELLDRVDIVVASVHSKLRMNSDAMTRRMLRAIADPHTNVLGHCTGRMVTGKGRPESTFDADLVFEACRQFDVAVEISSRPERLDPPRRLLRQAVDTGCVFSLDTDAHAPGQLDWLQYGAARAVECEVPVERIVTTWPLDRLLAWSGGT